MFIDPGTLHDLDVLSTSTRGGTLFGLVDRTRSRVGSEQLRRRLASPPRSSEQVLAHQRAHRELAANAVEYRRSLDAAGLDAVDRYLGSTWQPPTARRWIGRAVEALWLRLRYREFFRTIEDGQIRVAGLLDSAATLGQRLDRSNEVVLRAIGAEIQSQVELAGKTRLLDLSGRRSMAASLAFDQLARGSGAACLRALIVLLGQLEAMASLAAATVEHGWTYPRVGSQLIARGLIHPLLGKRAIPNDLILPPEVRVCFLTGPNMAGKSTFLRAVALAMLLAQAGCGVPAAEMEFSPVDAIFSSIQIQDDLSSAESFYLAEVRRIKALALILRERGAALAVIDEPFRGTNVHDATEATLAIIARLTERTSALVFIASHLGEVVPEISNDARVRLLHFAADLGSGEPRFDYQLRDGASSQRLGMTLLKREGVLELLSQ
jgi:DNA mismatch repair ATPase MutS